MGDGGSGFLLRDPVSAGTHLFWCLWSVYATGLLWKLARGDRGRQVAVGCFGLSMVLLYAASGTYHAIPARFPALIHAFRLLDHSGIYVLIAGTYTPTVAVLLAGRLRVAILTLVWGVAAAGIACKCLLPWPPYWLTVALYIGMGWLTVLFIVPLVRAVGLRGLAWVVVGGACYMAGGVCDAVEWPVLYPGVVGSHEVLHVLDMGGTLAHVLFVTRYVLPLRA
jgi:hemolysin III